MGTVPLSSGIKIWNERYLDFLLNSNITVTFKSPAPPPYPTFFLSWFRHSSVCDCINEILTDVVAPNKHFYFSYLE